jgi:hypothetical protein
MGLVSVDGAGPGGAERRKPLSPALVPLVLLMKRSVAGKGELIGGVGSRAWESIVTLDVVTT